MKNNSEGEVEIAASKDGQSDAQKDIHGEPGTTNLEKKDQVKLWWFLMLRTKEP